MNDFLFSQVDQASGITSTVVFVDPSVTWSAEDPLGRLSTRATVVVSEELFTALDWKGLRLDSRLYFFRRISIVYLFY